LDIFSNFFRTKSLFYDKESNMGGFCGVVSKEDCVSDLFFGTDYHSHLGTHRGGMAVLKSNGTFHRSIHNIQNTPFRSKFEHDLATFSGNMGIGVISDTDPQPLVMTSKLGTFAIVTVGLITNIEEIKNELFKNNCMQLQYSTTSGMVGPTEVVSALIATQDSIVDGLKYVHEKVKGS
jgi:amidophosphoribosyltransferase